MHQEDHCCFFLIRKISSARKNLPDGEEIKLGPCNRTPDPRVRGARVWGSVEPRFGG